MAPPCTTKEDKLNGSNYSYWKLQLKVWFIHKGLWELMQGFEKKPVRPNQPKKWTAAREDSFQEEL